MAANDKNEPEVIEIVEEILDNQMFVVAVVGGAVLGAILIYAWMEYQKSPNSLRLVNAPRPQAPEMDTSDDRPQEMAYQYGEDGA